jgi:hypothetical protein
MGQTVSSLFNQPEKNIEIVVHVDELLEDGQRSELTDYLLSTDGIESAEFCPLRWHLMLVQYDRKQVTSQDVLGRVHARNIHAELIGPV